MSLLENIVRWGETLPNWQKEAVRMLLTQEEITTENKAQLYMMYKKENGLIDSQIELIEPKPFKIEEIVGTSDTGQNITLKKIQNINNVNALPENAELSFAHQGLTVIYGENGSGKSGYARVLKKACFARDDEGKILNNIFDTSTSRSGEANFKIDVNGQEEYHDWIDEQKKPEILGNICVFDNKCARVILDEKNAVIYLPYGADVFHKLAEIVKEFKTILEREKPIPEKPEIPELTSNTNAGRNFDSINLLTKDEELEEWLKWTDEDEDKLNEKNVSYANSLNKDTTRQIRTLENIKNRLNSFKEKFVEYLNILTPDSVKEFNQLIESRNNFQKAFDIASKVPEGPLPGIATNEWQALYWAAKEYSIKQAYPGEEFPVVNNGKICVLCMQPLSEEAERRLKNFQVYMESSVKSSLDNTNNSITIEINQIKNLDFTKLQGDYKDILDEIENRNKEISKLIKGYLAQANTIKEALVKSEINKQKCIEDGRTYDLSFFDDIFGIINSEIKELQKNSKPEEIEKLRNELIEIRARKQFYQNRTVILSYINSLKLSLKYNQAINNLDTTNITKTGKKLVGEALTPQLKERLCEELNFLGANYIPINIQHTGIYGENIHQFKIDGKTVAENIKLTDILSEGEQRVIAIAGFLSELSLQGNTAPMIFDDPVSSMDHKYSEKVAERLVNESNNRQVIIFTHNIGFLLDLMGKSEMQGIPCYCINVHREGNVVGKILDGEPWHAMTVNKKINYIERELPKIASSHQSNLEEYNEKAGILYGYLRETWESAIEETLFNGVIKRFQPEVKTQSLRGVIIEKSDYEEVERGMTKCSKWMIGHALSKEIIDNRPLPIEIRQDIEDLKTFTQGIRSKRKTTEKMRKTPLPKVG